MRMKYVYHLLKENYDALKKLKIESDTYKVGNSTSYRGLVKYWKQGREALVSVSNIPSFKEFCFSIVNNTYFAQESDSFAIPYEEYANLSVKYAQFLMRIVAIIEFCEASGFEASEQGFDVKMPPTDDFDEFAKNIEQLNKAINQCPYLNLDGEKITLKKTDIGSIWFEFVIIAGTASIILQNLAKIVDKCIKIKSHYVTLRQQEEMLRQAKLKNDELETVMGAFSKVQDAVFEGCLEELKQEIPEIELKDDGAERVKYTLKTISKLMDKGMEIYASIDSPQEIKDLFPISDEVAALPKSPELLGDGERQ